MEIGKIHEYTDAYMEAYMRSLDKMHNPDLAAQVAVGVIMVLRMVDAQNEPKQIPAGIIHTHGRPDGHQLSGDQQRKQETGRHLPRNRTGSAGSGRIRRGGIHLTGGQP